MARRNGRKLFTAPILAALIIIPFPSAAPAAKKTKTTKATSDTTTSPRDLHRPAGAGSGRRIR